MLWLTYNHHHHEGNLMNDRHFFSFGPDQHPVRNAVVEIIGVDADTARNIMVALYGRDWCAQYAEPPRWAQVVRVVEIPAEEAA